MRTVPIQIISILLGTLFFAFSNAMWADEPDPMSGVIPQDCQDVRAVYKAERQIINQSCWSERDARTDAQRYCSDNGLWNPYCHTPCDQTPPTLGKPKDANGLIAHTSLCTAQHTLENCRAQKVILLEEHQQVVNEICCPFWPCKSKTTTYDFESLNIGPIHGQDNWVVTGFNANILHARVADQSLPYNKALGIFSLGGARRLYVSRVNNADWAFPEISKSFVRIEFDLNGNFWGNRFNLAYDADHNGQIANNEISSNEVGFGLRTLRRFHKIELYDANDTVVSSATYSNIDNWNRYRIEIDLKANNEEGSATVYVSDSGGTIWTTLMEDINMGFNPNASDKTNPSNLNGIQFFQDADRSQLDNITITSW